jgi:hypothetical protein
VFLCFSPIGNKLICQFELFLLRTHDIICESLFLSVCPLYDFLGGQNFGKNCHLSISFNRRVNTCLPNN